MSRWYTAKESKRGGTAHLAGHHRLGPTFSKCGKTLGREVTKQTADGAIDLCRLCIGERAKEEERAKIAASVPAAGGVVSKIATPELDKMEKAKESSQIVGEFAEWLSSEGLAICLDDEDGWHPTRKSIEELLAKFFEIDLAKVEQEKRAILEAIRK